MVERINTIPIKIKTRHSNWVSECNCWDFYIHLNGGSFQILVFYKKYASDSKNKNDLTFQTTLCNLI